MKPARAFAGKRYAVLGLARTGVSVVDYLWASSASLVAWDDREEARARVEGKATLADPMTMDLARFDAVIVSPGVPLNTHPIAIKADEAGVPVIGDIELFAQARAELPDHKVVGITGTNGKSTVTALIHHICQTAGVPSLMGGNIGNPILAEPELPEGGVYVLELSSFQIDLTQSLDCDVAILLNITPDHLDRYADFDAYAASKARLFAMQGKGDVAIIGIDDAPSAGIADAIQTADGPEPVEGLPSSSGDTPKDKAGLRQAQSKRDGETQRETSAYEKAAPPRVIKISAGGCMDQSNWPALQGPHNAQNAIAAMTAAREIGIAQDAIEEGLRTYPGLPHRMERVGDRRGVLFVNDSKATNPESAAPALAAYPHVHWIVGGRPKGADLDACAPHFDHVRAAYTIGEAAHMFEELLRPHMEVRNCFQLRKAVELAAETAKEGETVLLSPACASYDQYASYEERGDEFRGIVRGLA